MESVVDSLLTMWDNAEETDKSSCRMAPVLAGTGLLVKDPGWSTGVSGDTARRQQCESPHLGALCLAVPAETLLPPPAPHLGTLPALDMASPGWVAQGHHRGNHSPPFLSQQEEG